MQGETTPMPDSSRDIQRGLSDASARYSALESNKDGPSSRLLLANLRGEALPDSVDLVESTLARRNIWLRFPAALEVLFQADTLEPRRRLLLVCALIGCFGTIVGTLNADQLAPDISPMIWRILWIWEALALLCTATVWFLPKRLRRNWQGEALTAFFAFTIDVMLIWWAQASSLDTSITHSATAMIAVIFVCIAARLRFYWALGMAVAVFLSYSVFVQGNTPTQEMVISGNIALMALSFIFVLSANYTFEHRERRNWLLRKYDDQQRDVLVETSQYLRTLAAQDPLTGLYNRRQFDAELARFWSEATQNGQGLALLMLDVDFFKRYNDTYGHPAGDTCLIKIAEQLSLLALARGGVAARIGGEEFAVLLPLHTAEQAEAAATTLCEAIRAARIEHRESSVAEYVTVSVGVAQLAPSVNDTPSELIALADQGLYQAKSNGRNQACLATTLTSPIMHNNERDVSNTFDADDIDPAAVPLLHESEVQSYIQILKDKFIWLRFPAEIERVYRNHNAEQRRKYLALVAVVGLIIYNFYVYANSELFADVAEKAVTSQLYLTVTLLIFTVVMYQRVMSPVWREFSFCLGTSIVAVVSAWLMSQSLLLTALTYAVCLSLIPMFSGVGARQPFWFTFASATVTLIATMLLFDPVGDVFKLVYLDTVFILASNTVYTLILAYTLEYGARKEWLFSQIERVQNTALVKATEQLHRLSISDPLTGIRNRRQFEVDFDRIWEESQKEAQPVGLLIIDVDFFKLYNDSYGHPAGDACLQRVAVVINETAQASKGMAARLGGEEFGVLLPGGDLDQIALLGEKICAAVRNKSIDHKTTTVDGQKAITVSVGAASLIPSKALPSSKLLAVADDALYQAKEHGRNQVSSLSEPVL